MFLPPLLQIIYANASLSEMLGYTSEQLIKMRLHELLPEPYAQLHQRYIKGRGGSPPRLPACLPA